MINLDIERCQNPRLKFLAKNLYWHSNASKGVRTLKPVIDSLSFYVFSAFERGVRMLGPKFFLGAFEHSNL